MEKVRVFDIEANGLSPDKIHCMVFSSLDHKHVDKFRPHQMEEAIKYLDSCDVIIGHNILSYDLPAIKKVLGYDFKGKKVDTLLMSRLQNPNREVPMLARKDPKASRSPHGLGCWGYRVGRGKPEHEDWENFSEEMLHRCSEDVEINIEVYHALRKEAEGLEWKNAHLLTFKLFENLAKQEEAGWLADQEYMHRSIGLLNHWVRKIDAALAQFLPVVYEINETKKDGEYNYVRKPFMKSGKYSASVEKHYGYFDPLVNDGYKFIGGPFSRITYRTLNLNSNDETKKFLLSEGWIPEVWNTNDAGEPTSPKMSKDEKFEGVNGKMGKLIVKRVQALHRRSQIEGWLKRVREDGRIPARVSGLAETRRAKHAEIVNVPNAEAFFGKQMRKGFTSRDGWVLVSADAASCQDRMMAERAGNDEFTKMLLEGNKDEGTDSHTLAQAGINPVLEFFKLPTITRNKAKNYNFGWTFGASDAKLGKMCGGTKEAGGELRGALRKVFPAKAALIDKVTAEWESHAQIRVNRWGKKEYYNGWIRGLDGAPVYIASGHAALVYAVQSDEAIYMTATYNLIHKYLAQKYEWGKDYVVVCFYHDEVTVECREELAEDIAKIVEKAFTVASDYFKFKVPQKGTASIGKTWYDVH